MKTQLNIWLKCCFVVAVGLFISACQKEQPTANVPSSVVGIYTLVSIDGKPVPTSISEQGVSLEMRSGTFTINANGTCSSKMVFVPPGGTEVTFERGATYTMNGSALTMQWQGAGITVGTIDGNTFTMANEGMVFVYKK